MKQQVVCLKNLKTHEIITQGRSEASSSLLNVLSFFNKLCLCLETFF